ncbi:MAG TPA: PKD domain-containing protein [bacterium]|nr:PKD domain-containing protein [bacterium]HPN42105.1 PKD domain-containing protein [bacterium]
MRYFLMILCIACLCGCDRFSQQPVRIVAIGDSITQGRAAEPATQSFRYPLWKKLVDAGVKFDFVGSLSGGFEGDPDWPDYKGLSFDRDHEGHWGWKADNILEKLPGWLAGYTPDMALLLLGSNDLDNTESVAQTGEEMSQIIDLLRADNPDVIIFLGLSISEWKAYPALSEAYIELTRLKTTDKSPVIPVRHHTGWISDPQQPGTHTVDWVHPNQAGDLKLAQNWFRAMAPYLKVKITNHPPVAQIMTNTIKGPAPLAVEFNASGSADPDGNITSFGWQFGDGSNHAGGESVSYTYNTPGVYQVELGVTDNVGDEGLARVTITVSESKETLSVD